MMEGIKPSVEGIATQEDIDAVVGVFKEAIRAGDGACMWHETFERTPVDIDETKNLWRVTSANLRQCIAVLTGKTVFEVIEELADEEDDE